MIALRVRAALAASLLTGAALAIAPQIARAAGTAAGTQINNTATASYSDGTNTYNTTSNTVTSYVQNAPSLTIVANPSTQTTTPGTAVTDSYTVTNTGNARAYFQFTAASGTDNSTYATSLTYSIQGNGSAQNLTLAQLNNYLKFQNTAGTGGANPYYVNAGASITITENYTDANSTPDGTALHQTLKGDSYQPGPDGGNLNGAANTADADTTGGGTQSAVVTDTSRLDARLTVTKGTPTVSGANPATLLYTVSAYNSGKQNAVLVKSASLTPLNNATNPAFSADSYFISDKVALTTKYGSAVALDTSYTIPAPTVPAGCTGTVVYTTAANGLSAWTTVEPASGTTYIGLVISGCSLAPGSAGQISFTYRLKIATTSSGDANADAVTNVANSIIGTQSGTLSGPFQDGSSPANDGTATVLTTVATSPIGNTQTGKLGEGDVTSAAAAQAYSVLLGPYIASAGAPAYGADSKGSYNGSASIDNTNDFTAISFLTSNASVLASYTPGTGGPQNGTFTGTAFSVGASPVVVYVEHSVYNNGNGNDTYKITGTLNGSWPAGTTLTLNTTASTVGAQTSGNFSVAVNAGASGTFYAIYTLPANANVTPFQQYDATLTATSSNNSTANTTHDDLYAGGFIAVGKTQSFTSDGCATAAVTVSQPVPGGCILYAIAYKNVAPSAGGTGASGNVSLTGQGLTLADDGRSDGTNGWYAGSALGSVPTIGITVAPSDVTPAPSSASTITYYTWSFGSGLYGAGTTTFNGPTGSPLGATTSGPAKVSVLVGGSSTYAINPQDYGTFTFKVQVRSF